MPVKVPEEPKTYTTVYDNFKGVDFTNDPSNVYRRRSPSGKNMLPDLDGRPYKRTGWDIRFSFSEYKLVYDEYDATDTYSEYDMCRHGDGLYRCIVNIPSPEAWDATHWEEIIRIDPDRLHHFSYGGHDYLMIFNSVGVFYVRDDIDELVLCEMATPDNDDYIISRFPPKVTRELDGVPTTVVMPADANKAFFFEGGGEAGFYVFVENDIYKFTEIDTGGMYFVKVDPKVPVIMIGATPAYCNGTDYDSLNMLTDRRSIQYFGDDTATYALPSAPDSAANTKVEILDANTGHWVEKKSDDASYSWTLNGSIITFTNQKPPQSTVDNVRITYSPSDGTTYVLESDLQTETKSITNEFKTLYYQDRRIIATYEYNETTRKWKKIDEYEDLDDWFDYQDQSGAGTATLEVPGIFSRESFTLYADYTGSPQPVTSYTANWGAYNSSVAINIFDDSIAKDYGTTKSVVSGWTKLREYTDQADADYKIVTTYYRRNRTITKSKRFNVYGTYTKATQKNADNSINESRDAFSLCRKCLTFGNNITNQIFISASTRKNYRNRVWYCAANDPSFFPESNFIEVGADDKSVMGLINVDKYLGLVKMGGGTGAALYLAYPTSFESEATYAVRQSVAGIGAIATGAFNVLNEEPLFLSDHGVMGVDIASTDTNKQIRNRSYFINKKLLAEEDLSGAVSYVHKGLYYLAVNNRCYVLDGSQKSSWANEKTNLQYECYYLENIPAQCFASMGDTLYFTDFSGNLCYFKDSSDPAAYVDRYQASSPKWVSSAPPVDMTFTTTDLSGDAGERYLLSGYSTLDDLHNDKRVYLAHDDDGRLLVTGGAAQVGDVIRYVDSYYTIHEIVGKVAHVWEGVPIHSEWSTMADDDQMVQYFKNLKKKGGVISLYPESQSSVEVLLKPDEKDPVSIGTTITGETTLPFDAFAKKKIKKYKRLQIICRNNIYNDGFGVDQIVKTYTVGNYSKNRG